MSNVYERLGVATIINAKGTATRVSGAPMPPEIAAAMQEATQHCVDMAQLQGRVSEIIAQATGAEAGMVTAGASAGLLLGTAACLAGLDPARMNRLPDTAGMRDEAVVVRSQRNVASALLQNLDHDLFFEQWRPPPTLFAGRVLCLKEGDAPVIARRVNEVLARARSPG